MASIKDEDDMAKPWLGNYPVLEEWVQKHKGICMWQKMDVAQSVECWFFGKSMAIIVVHAKRRGWDIFTPCAYTEIETTLADAEKRLGLG